MDAQTVLDNFGTIAEAPGGVDQLRELIFDLAVCGKLVPQDPTDEPAPELLDRICADKVAIAAQTGARSGKRPPPLEEPDIDLPQGWIWTQLDTLGFVGPRNDVADSVIAGFVPMTLVPAELREPHSFEEMPWGAIKKSYTHVANGDIAVAKITPCFENGKSTVFEALPGGVGAATTELHVLRPIPGGVVPRFVLLYLKSPLFRRGGEPRMTGTAGQKRLPRDYFSGSPFPLPPREEQERIVAKVDELMQLCDDLEVRQQARHHVTTRLRASSLDALTSAETDDDLHTAWSRIHTNWEALTHHPESIDAVRQTILQLAVRGKLVAQDPDDPDAHQLFRELVAERERLTSEKAIRRRATLPPVALDEQSFQVPSTWTWVRLDDIGDWGAGATPKRGESRYFGGPHNWFKSGELNDSPALSGPSDETVTDDALAECSLRLNRVGDVLVAMYGATIGRTAILASEGTTNQAVCACTCFSGFDNEFLFLLLRSRRRELVQMGAGGAQPNISREKIVQSPIPLPPFAEQKRIVKRATELFRLCDELEAQLVGLQSASISLARGFTAATAVSASAVISA